jgi:hypothetical protein
MTPKRPTFAELAIRGAAARDGTAAGDRVAFELSQLAAARKRTLEQREEATAIGRARAARGAGRELDDDRRAEDPRRARPKQRARAERRSRSLAQSWQARRKRDGDREVAAAERAAEAAFAACGIRHHYRPVPKFAWFAAYVAGCDKNGALALRALRSVGMPEARQKQVLAAAYEPTLYTPRRDVTRGARAAQRRFAPATARELPRRPEEHPGAVRVIQCAVFLWLAKGGSRRRGYSARVRGFGRGLFAALTRSGKDALYGHDQGVPGALVALRSAGFIDYGQPPTTAAVGPLDRGPSGHAYLMYWFRSSPAELELERYHEAVRGVARLPAFERALADLPSWAEWIESRAQAPPVVVDPSSIPF